MNQIKMNLAPLSGLIPAEALICQGMGLLFNLAEFKKGRTMKEIWKDIPDYEGLYQASNLGRIKRLSRHISVRGFNRKLKEIIMKQNPHRCGYLQINLRLESTVTTYYVHRVIASAFMGKSELHVDHIDGDKRNNNLSNLEYVTQAENIRRYIKKAVIENRFITHNKKRSGKTSKYIGVYYRSDNKKWRVEKRYLGKKYNVGCFDNEEDAKVAYENFKPYSKG